MFDDMAEAMREGRERRRKFEEVLGERKELKEICVTPCIVRQASTEVDYREYHLQVRVVNKGERTYWSDPSVSGLKEDKQSILTPLGFEIANKLEELNGVEEISMDAYKMQVKKGKAFQWKHLQHIIVSIIKTEILDSEKEEPNV